MRTPTAVPVATVLLAILAIWYVFTALLNAPWALDQARRAGASLSMAEVIADTMSQSRPRLPAPHQVAEELWKSTATRPVTSRRSLVFHAGVTLSTAMLGFLLGAGLGMLLAIAIVHDRTTEISVMPWVIATQTIPILAIAPMVVVVLSALGVTGLLPKAVISAYLSFFPVTVGMVKGLRSPASIQRDLMLSYNASAGQVLWKLRLPSSLPFLFPSLKVAVAASLVGAIVAELPINQEGGLGARLLTGSYYGQTVQIWAALLMAAAVAALLVAAVSWIQAAVLRRQGGEP